MKTCFKCKKELPIEDFYRHSEMADGHLNKCKTCTQKDSIERYYDPEARDRIIAYEKAREQTPERKKKKLEYQRRRRKKSPEKNLARSKVQRALKKGIITRGLCEVCSVLKTEAHHEDYSKPLEVRWLCRKHHMEAEGKIPF